MFPWNIAQSAEATFFRWAVKHGLKFLLKKKLGQFILGELDLDQLDVQLGAGTVKLKDLALNVAFINQKLGASPIIVKEGSIGSLSITIPWRVQNCQVEVEELELVLVPCARSNGSNGSETSGSTQDSHGSSGSGKMEHERGHSPSAIPADVHEGVKKIAKMVKWLLTSFHVKVKKLIVAYDPCSNKDEVPGSNRILVLRITEMKYGTCVSADTAESSPTPQVDSFLGMTRLTNFVTFEGATVELLQMDDVDEIKTPCASDATSSDWSAGCSTSQATTPILTGYGGGFSGNLKLSIPWKNGSLDIHKVGVDVKSDPIEFNLQLSTILWIICSWQTLKNMDKDGQGHWQYRDTHSVYFNSASQFHSSTPGSTTITIDRMAANTERFSPGAISQTSLETPRDALLRGTNVIPDWVPLCRKGNQKGILEPEPDYSASIDQFFECFDELRTSNSVLGNSGILNWTCSVFSAITAASSLASGSKHIPCEQQHVETNVEVSVKGISIVLPLHDENQKFSPSGNLTDAGCNLHYVGAKFESLLLVLQIRPHETEFEATVEHVEFDHYFSDGSEAVGFGLSRGKSTVHDQSLLIQKMQADVQGDLPFFQSVHPVLADDGIGGMNQKTIPMDNLVKVKLLKAFSAAQCQFTLAHANSSLTSSASFSLELPPFIFWVNFKLVNLFFDLFRKVEKSFQMNNDNKDSDMEALREKFCCSCHGNVKGGRCDTCFPSKISLRGNITLSNGRIILCFPWDYHGDHRCYSLWNEFICLDVSQPSGNEFISVDVSQPSGKEKIQSVAASSLQAFSHKASGSVHVGWESLKIYLITSKRTDASRNKFHATKKCTYIAEEILSVNSTEKCFCGISMLWQEGRLTGPSVSKMARDLVTSHDINRSNSKATGTNYEFASARTAGDQDDINSCTRQGIIQSSATSGFFVHVRLLSISVGLGSSQYQRLLCLLNQVIDGFLSVAIGSRKNSRDPVIQSVDSAPQTSVVVECESVNFLINLEKVEEIKSSLKTELPGSWNRLKLQVQKLELLSVSNIGGISGGNLFWLSHGEGKLWGTVDDFPAQELVLVSCSSSTVRRGNGEGTNALSLGSAGIAIVHLWDPQNCQSFTTVTSRGGTIVAPGGRLDWVNAICHFFTLPSENDPAHSNDIQKGSSEETSSDESSFVVNLVDIALSYEPFTKKFVSSDKISEPLLDIFSDNNEELCGPYVGCLLAAASLNISNRTAKDSTENEHKVRLQDLGLLLCEFFRSESLGGTYDVEYLHKTGYVKVAGEALVEAVLRTNCKNGLLWELECNHSHINLDTCHDTASGLVRLVAQLQQLFAPDVQESVVHLQSRWNSVQQAHSSYTSNESKSFNGDSASSPCFMQGSGQHATDNSGSGTVTLMDEVCEDVFHFNGNGTSSSGSHELQSHISLDGTLLGEVCNLNISNSKVSPRDVLFSNQMSRSAMERTQTSSLQNDSIPELIEGYYISGLCSLSGLSTRGHSMNVDRICNSRNEARGHAGTSNSGWYQDSIKIVENHIPKVTQQLREKEFSEEMSFANSIGPDEICEVRGRIFLKNIDVRWRLYAGSDWHTSRKKSAKAGGRDATTCIELTLSGLNLQYDIIPDGKTSVSKLSLSVQNFNIYDHSEHAPWKLVLGYYHSKDHPEESSAKAFKLDLEAVRPDLSTPLEEYRLRVAFQPMLLHLDQDQLDFLIAFFEGKGSSADQPPSPHDVYGSRLSSTDSSSFGGYNIAEEALLPFFQKFDIWPVVIRVDYSPRRVDLAALRGGNYVHLVNLVPWKGVEIELKHVHAGGIYGWSSVCETMVGEWLEDISNNQIHKFVKGLPPIRSLFSVGSGAAKLVSLPVKNYKKDHRLLKGIQRGAMAFLRSISLEAVGLGVHLAAGAHDILLQTEYILTSIPPSVSSPTKSKPKTNIRSNQPKDAQQGIQQAYESLSDGLGKTASALVGSPLKTYQRGSGAGSALASAACAAPAAVVAPASAAMRAVHCALLGIRNSLDPEHKKESAEKYMGPLQPGRRS